MPIGVVSGLLRETNCLVTNRMGDSDPLSFAGVGPELSEYGAHQLIAKGAEALVSFGIAGGITPGLRAGTLVLATKVIDGDNIFEPSGVWRSSLKRLLPADIDIVEGPIIGVDMMVSSQYEKHKLHINSGAVACDMETHAVARVAVEKNLPFIVIRTVSDPAWRDVPDWVLSCLINSGEVDYFCLALALGKRPWQLPALLYLARNAKRAFSSLRSIASAAGPGLGFSRGF